VRGLNVIISVILYEVTILSALFDEAFCWLYQILHIFAMMKM